MAWQNFYSTKLFAEISATDTTITVEKPPKTAPGRLVIEARNKDKREIISFGSIAGNQLRGVTRGIGGTTASSHLKGSVVEMNVTAEDLEQALALPDTLTQFIDEDIGDHIVPNTGLYYKQSGFRASMGRIVYYINGHRYVKEVTDTHTFSPNKDTYVSIDTNKVEYFEEYNLNSEVPTARPDRILVAKVITNGTGIERVVTYNHGPLSTLPGYTSEIRPVVGFEWMGKQVYRKCISFQGRGDGVEKVYGIDDVVANIDELVRLDACINVGDTGERWGNNFRNPASPNTQVFILKFADFGGKRQLTYTSGQDGKINVIIEFTKRFE